MPLCSGPPSGPCPLKVNDSSVSFCIADEFQCPACLLVRFPPSKNTAPASEFRESRTFPSWIPVTQKVSKFIGHKEIKTTHAALNTPGADRNTPNFKPVTYNRSKPFPTAPSTFVHITPSETRIDSTHQSSSASIHHVPGAYMTYARGWRNRGRS